MSKTSTFSCAIGVSGDGLVSNCFIPPQSPFTNANAPGAVPAPVVSLSSGENAIAVPSGAAYVAISPSLLSTNTKTAKGATGDTGFNFTNQMLVLPVAGLSSFYINSTAAETITLAWF